MSSFAEQMAVEKARLAKLMHDTYVGSCITLCDRIIEDTPRDTGALKGAWHTSTNREFITDDNPRFADESGSVAKDENRLVFNTVRLEVPIFFTNGMSYSEKIELGDPNWQRPEGMMIVNIQRWPSIVLSWWRGDTRGSQ